MTAPRQSHSAVITSLQWDILQNSPTDYTTTLRTCLQTAEQLDAGDTAAGIIALSFKEDEALSTVQWPAQLMVVSQCLVTSVLTTVIIEPKRLNLSIT